MAEKVIAQKFGGTSVATPESRQMVIGHVRRACVAGYRPVLVVSAMGRRGDPFATETLLDLIRSDGERPDGRDEDLIFHCGEIISAVVMSHSFKRAGIPAVALTGGQAGIYTDGRWRRAKICNIDAQRMLVHVNQGEIPVVTGGQGVTAEGEVTILGRGSSDTSGVAVGLAVGAEKIEIYSDVRGVALCDPRVVPQARYLAEIDYRLIYEVGLFGAKVMHPGAVLMGQRAGVPIVCRSTFDEDPGTTITSVAGGPDLVGIPSLGPVVLLAVHDAPPADLQPGDLFDQFAAVGMRGADGCTVVGVSTDWRAPLEASLKLRGARVEPLAIGKTLVSMIGRTGFIRESFEPACSILEGLGLAPAFLELSEIRSTFAVPAGESARVVQAFYQAFVPAP